MKGRLYAVFISIIVIISGFTYVIIFNHDSSDINKDIDVSNDTYEENQITDIDLEEDINKEKLYVHVCGAVVNEGVYEIKKDTRVFEVIDLAGGLTDEADTKLINQARIVSDQEKLYFPTKEEVENGFYIEEEHIESSLININAASKEQLMLLPGIGESKAKSILQYRDEHGSFSSKEDIMNVNGIKEGLYYNIESHITVK